LTGYAISAEAEERRMMKLAHCRVFSAGDGQLYIKKLVCFTVRLPPLDFSRRLRTSGRLPRFAWLYLHSSVGKKATEPFSLQLQNSRYQLKTSVRFVKFNKHDH
jgi:hypothetical protein